jgi:uncharacterized protein (TIGR00730 family)
MDRLRPRFKSICVFCGSRPGSFDEYPHAAKMLGAQLARNGIELVYGGGHVGLMGMLADAALQAGGRVTGVITRALHDKEIAHTGITELIVVESMHQRKALMSEKAEAFIALPGGFGTFEELFEVVTWAQLGIHEKPVGLLNVRGYYDPVMQQLDLAIAEGFVRAEHRTLLAMAEDPELLLEQMASYRPVHVSKWLDRTETWTAQPPEA